MLANSVHRRTKQGCHLAFLMPLQPRIGDECEGAMVVILLTAQPGQGEVEVGVPLDLEEVSVVIVVVVEEVLDNAWAIFGEFGHTGVSFTPVVG